MPSARSTDPAALAHDLNNLLLAIVNASEAAEASLSGPLTEQTAALARSGLQTVVLAAQQAAGLARAIMDAPASAAPAAQKEGAAAEGEPSAPPPAAPAARPVDLPAFLATHRNLFAALVGKRALFELDPVPTPPPPCGLADPSALSRIVGNFIKNAAEALAEHGGTRIRVRVVPMQWGGRVPGDLGPAPEGFVGTAPPPDAGRDGVAVEVVDDGPGVPPDVAPTVFSRARTTKATGHGIGLSEAPAMAYAMGGCVSYRPAEPHGSVFSVWMPAAKEAPAAEKPAEPPAPAPKPGAPRAAEPGAAILLVDDDPGILQAAAILFRVMGFQPLTATSLEEAVAAFNANAARIRATVLDANVGDGTSAPLLDAIKGSVPTLPCIIASGYSEQKTATVFAGHRYDAFLGKPYTRSELAAILARFSLVR